MRSFTSGSITALIDRELQLNPEIKNGCSAYAAMIARWRETGDLQALVSDMLDYAARCYREAGNPAAELYEFNDGAADFLFDMATNRVAAVWGWSASVAANSRDNAYHKGYPTAGAGHDKGHLWSHAQGGREGGPNYIRQARRLNQALSANGKLWRAIESYLAANAGLLALVRLIYTPGTADDKPHDIEYCLFSADGQFRAVIFPNR